MSTWQAVRAGRAENLAEILLHDEQEARRQADEAQQSEAGERRRAETVVVQTKVNLGTRMLNEGDSLGLLELLEANRVAENLPELRCGMAQVWALAYQGWAGRLLDVLPAAESLAFHPDGRHLAIAHNSKAFLWDVQKGEPVSAPLELGAPLSMVAFSPDGRLLAASTERDDRRDLAQVFVWHTDSACVLGARPVNSLRAADQKNGESNDENPFNLAARTPGRPIGRCPRRRQPRLRSAGTLQCRRQEQGQRRG